MARMTRVSPPELAREFPGPQASTSVTLAPPRRSISAVQPPKAPAPTTTTAGAAAPAAGGPAGGAPRNPASREGRGQQPPRPAGEQRAPREAAHALVVRSRI